MKLSRKKKAEAGVATVGASTRALIAQTDRDSDCLADVPTGSCWLQDSVLSLVLPSTALSVSPHSVYLPWVFCGFWGNGLLTQRRHKEWGKVTYMV